MSYYFSNQEAIKNELHEIQVAPENNSNPYQGMPSIFLVNAMAVDIQKTWNNTLETSLFISTPIQMTKKVRQTGFSPTRLIIIAYQGTYLALHKFC
jgi:hypothetical protein